MSFEALNERYQSLGALVTSGMDSCAAAGLQSGQAEKIECTFPQGTLVLTTYASGAELTAARQRRLNDKEGTIVANVESGAYYRFDPTTADSESTAPPIIYWDSQAGVQSAELTGGSGITADQLDPAFEAVSATVTPPDGPMDVAVEDFNSTFTVINCTRIPTETDGESEESECKRSGRTDLGRQVQQGQRPASLPPERQDPRRARTATSSSTTGTPTPTATASRTPTSPSRARSSATSRSRTAATPGPLHRRPRLPLLPADVRQGQGRPPQALRPDLQ